MSDDPRDPEVVATELAETLGELQGELRPRRPPRPPTPRELLRFTDEYAIPALVAGLEASIRTLELLQGAIRLIERRPTGDRERRAPDLGEAGRATLDRLDDLLADVGDAVEGEPSDPEARRLLAEARSLREELDAALDPARSESPGTGHEVPVDVEGELQSIKEDLDDDEDGGA